jgi:glycosyltransferase involved in cell wall biosynthesis
VHVTQNGDWPVKASGSEYRYFRCDGLVCTNNEYFDRNREHYPSVLIPNGVSPDLFAPGDGARTRLGLAESVPIVLMVSALIGSKRVVEGIRFLERTPGVHLVVAGDGPLREQVDREGTERLGSRFTRRRFAREEMPDLYRSADVFLHMSQDEPSANAYIEALSSGLPIVTHDRSVTRWTFESTAVLVDTSDDAAVADGIRRALDLTGPEAVAARRELVARRFSWATIAAAYEDFLRETNERVVDGGRGGRS